MPVRGPSPPLRAFLGHPAIDSGLCNLEAHRVGHDQRVSSVAFPFATRRPREIKSSLEHDHNAVAFFITAFSTALQVRPAGCGVGDLDEIAAPAVGAVGSGSAAGASEGAGSVIRRSPAAGGTVDCAAADGPGVAVPSNFSRVRLHPGWHYLAERVLAKVIAWLMVHWSARSRHTCSMRRFSARENSWTPSECQRTIPAASTMTITGETRRSL